MAFMEEDKAGGCHARRPGRCSSDLRVGRNKVLSKIMPRHMASDRQQATTSPWFKSLSLPMSVQHASVKQVPKSFFRQVRLR